VPLRSSASYHACAEHRDKFYVILARVKATVRFVVEDLFLGITPSGHALTLDANSDRSSAPSPVEILLVALGSCTASDVAGILAKRRQQVTSYVIEISGERRDEYPRRFTSMKVHHILKGRSLSAKAVAQAIELSDAKYCSVAATLRPTVEIQSTFEIIEEPANEARE
jgi:putative redox protein